MTSESNNDLDDFVIVDYGKPVPSSFVECLEQIHTDLVSTIGQTFEELTELLGNISCGPCLITESTQVSQQVVSLANEITRITSEI